MRCSVFRSTLPSFPLLLPLPLLLFLVLVLSLSPTPTSALRITVLGDPLQIKVNEPTLVRWQHEPSDPPGFDFRFVIDERDVGLARANIVVDRPMDDEGFVDVRFPRPGIYEIKAVAGPGPRFRVIGTSNEVVVSRAAATTTTSSSSTSSTSSSTTSTSSSSPTPSPSTSTPDAEPLTDPARAGLIAGLILGSLILICLLVLLTIFVLRHRRIANEKSARLSFYPEQMVQAAPSRGGNGGDGSAGGGGNTLEGGGGGGGAIGLVRRTMSERGSKFLSRFTILTRSLSFSSSSAGAGDLEQGIINGGGGANGRGRLRNSSIANIITPFPPPSELPPPPPPTPSTRTSDGTVQHPPPPNGGVNMIQVAGTPVSTKPTVVSFAATIASPRGVVFTNPFETPAEREAREQARRVGVVRPLPTPPVVPTGPVPSSSIVTPPVSAGALRPLPQVPQPPSPAPPLTVRDSVHRPPSTPQPRTPLPLPVLPPISATPPLEMVQLQLEGSRHRALPSVPASGSNVNVPASARNIPSTGTNKTLTLGISSKTADRRRLLEDRLHAVQERIEEEEFRARVRLSEEMSLRSLGVHVDVPESPEGVPESYGVVPQGVTEGVTESPGGVVAGSNSKSKTRKSNDPSGVAEEEGGGVWTPLVDTLKEEREWLKNALESDWAGGRSDEVPCGYSRYMAA